jgi:iron-sulfur cluster assembly protein
MTISLTQNAAHQIRTQLEKRGKGLGLRLGVKNAGCSGFAYVLDYADELGEGDRVFEDHNVKVIVNDADMKILNGIQLDYAQEGINAAFKFNNPNVTDSCGCGESFAVK